MCRAESHSIDDDARLLGLGPYKKRATVDVPSRQFFSRAHLVRTRAVFGEFVRGAFSAERMLHNRGRTDVATNDSHAVKGARNQALIREVNERIEQLADDAAYPAFLCECANPDCVEMIELSIAEYELIRSLPTRFPVKPGHDYPKFERVVDENEYYIVVEKFGEAGEIVKELDTRSRS